MKSFEEFFFGMHGEHYPGDGMQHPGTYFRKITDALAAYANYIAKFLVEGKS